MSAYNNFECEISEIRKVIKTLVYDMEEHESEKRKLEDKISELYLTISELKMSKEQS